MKKTIRKLIIWVLAILGIYFSIMIYLGYDLYRETIEKESIETKIASIKAEKDNYINYSDIPKRYIDAVISVEDRRFFEHKGIDIISIARAVYADITTWSLAEGGSTITQQLAKNIYFTQKKEITRKIAEVFMAFEIEKTCSKEQIFELYANTIYYGEGYYCIYDASEGYFSKEPKDMDLYEMTLLAGIPNAPSVYSPKANPELSKQRHKQVIDKMLRFNYLTEEEAQELYKRLGAIINRSFNVLLGDMVSGKRGAY